MSICFRYRFASKSKQVCSCTTLWRPIGHRPSTFLNSNPSSCNFGRALLRYHIAFPFKYTSLPLWVPPPPPRGRGCSCPSHFVYPPPPLGVGFVCVPPAWVTEGGRGGSIEAAVTFFVARLRPFARASSSLEPIFPVFGASLSHCPPCAALSAEFFLGRPLGRGPRPGPGPNVRPWLMRTAMLLGIHLNPSDFSS